MQTIKISKFKPKIVFITGSPWAGKSTQCVRIVKKYPQFDAFNCGGTLRNAVKSECEIGNRVRDQMAKGEMVDSDTVIDLMEEFIVKTSNDMYLIDGFPRNKENLDCWA